MNANTPHQPKDQKGGRVKKIKKTKGLHVHLTISESERQERQDTQRRRRAAVIGLAASMAGNRLRPPRVSRGLGCVLIHACARRKGRDARAGQESQPKETTSEERHTHTHKGKLLWRTRFFALVVGVVGHLYYCAASPLVSAGGGIFICLHLYGLDSFPSKRHPHT